MSRYRRLGPRERYQIEILKGKGASQAEIARELNRCKSTVSRELKRLQGVYVAEIAGRDARSKLLVRSNANRKIKGKVQVRVDRLIRQDWSPEQIEFMLMDQLKTKLSLKTIYRYIERDKLLGGRLKAHLRILRRQRKDRKKKSYGVVGSLVKNRVPIDKRPLVVESRERIGDYERDTVLGTRGGRVLLTIVDRKTRYVHLACLERKSAELVHKATVQLLRSFEKKTITNDNGSEFSMHEKTSSALRTSIYFSRSYRVWERGTNENTNGLLRQYFPKQKPIPKLTKQQLKQIQDKLNMRPRKCLGFKTPYELYRGKPPVRLLQ